MDKKMQKDRDDQQKRRERSSGALEKMDHKA